MPKDNYNRGGGNDSRPSSSKGYRGNAQNSRSSSSDNSDRPYKNTGDKPYSSRNNGNKPYQSRSNGDKPYQSRSNGDKPYQSRSNGDKPYQSRSNGDKPYQSRSNGDKPYQSRNRDDRPSRSFERTEAEQPVTGYEQYERIFGRNAVREAIKSGRNINKLYVAKGETDHTLSFIVKLALEAGINVQYTDRRKLDSLTLNANHQGVLAVASPIEFVSVEDLLAVAAERGEKPFLVMLDGVTDPHNAGAIIRSAYAAGAHGIIISKRRSALISEGIFKSSAGSIEHMKIAQVANLPQTMSMLQEKHKLFSVCCDMKGKDYRQIDFDMPLLLVLGSEGDGLSRLISERCDITASIPMKGDLESLNVSVAAGIIMFAVLSSRG